MKSIKKEVHKNLLMAEATWFGYKRKKQQGISVHFKTNRKTMFPQYMKAIIHRIYQLTGEKYCSS